MADIRRFLRSLLSGPDIMSQADPDGMEAINAAAKLPNKLDAGQSIAGLAGDIAENKPISRRDVFKVAGAAAAASSSGLRPLRVAARVAQAASPPALGLMPKALAKGFDLPGGLQIHRHGNDLVFDFGDDLEIGQHSKEWVQKLQDAVERARASLGKPAPSGVSAFNHLTNSWHSPVDQILYRDEEKGLTQSMRHWLRAGESIPEAMPAGWEPHGTDWGMFDPRTFEEFQGDHLCGSITADTAPNLMQEWRYWKKRDLAWRNSPEGRAYHAEDMANDPGFREQYIEGLREFDLAPGGRADTQPVMDIDADPMRRQSEVQRWGQRMKYPLQRPGRAAIFSPVIGAALLAPQEQDK